MTALDRRYDTQIHRRVTRTVMVGDVPVGSEHPIVVQSMINEDTLDIEAAVAGIIRLAEAGSEIVRVTTPSMAHAKAMGQIRQELRQRGCTVPLVADVTTTASRLPWRSPSTSTKFGSIPACSFLISRIRTARSSAPKNLLPSASASVRRLSPW